MGYLKMREIVLNLSVLDGVVKNYLFTLMSFQTCMTKKKKTPLTLIVSIQKELFFCVLQMKECHTGKLMHCMHFHLILG